MARELKKTREYVAASLERGRGGSQAVQGEKHSTSQVKVVRVNNFIGSSGGKGARAAASSHSPSGLAGGASKDSAGSVRTKLKKGLKVVG